MDYPAVLYELILKMAPGGNKESELTAILGNRYPVRSHWWEPKLRNSDDPAGAGTRQCLYGVVGMVREWHGGPGFVIGIGRTTQSVSMIDLRQLTLTAVQVVHGMPASCLPLSFTVQVSAGAA
jgi:hypothetical protein